MRTPRNSPFRPGSDTVPEVWAGRTEQLNDWSTVLRPRLTGGIEERGRTILGEPGLGKSTLVRRIAQSAQEHGDWVTKQIRIPLNSDPLKAVSAAVLDLADQAGLSASRNRKVQDLLKRVRTVSVKGTSISLDRAEGPEPHTALTDLLLEVGNEARKAEVAVLIHIDEVQNISDQQALSQLLVALGDAITHQELVAIPGGKQRMVFPIAVYLTGLPEFSENANSNHGATFTRRFNTVTLSPISDADLLLALQPFIRDGWPVIDDSGNPGAVRMSQDAAELVVKLCYGEPFLFQLLGYRTWLAGKDDRIEVEDVERGWDAMSDEATRHVEKVLDSLPKKEREFIETMAEMDPSDWTLTKIAQRAGYAGASAAGATARRLDTSRGIISRGKRYSFRHRAIEAYLTTGWPFEVTVNGPASSSS